MQPALGSLLAQCLLAECPLAGVIIARPTVFRDDRGWLAEVFRRDECDPTLHPQMAYVSVTLAGHSRGPYEHLKQTDQFAFLGPGRLEVHLWDERSGAATFHQHWSSSFGAGRPAIVTIPPGVVHGYRNVGAEPAWVLNFPNQLYRGEGNRFPVDEIRHEDDPDSPFQFDW